MRPSRLRWGSPLLSEALERVQVFPVHLALQPFWDAVGELVVFLDPLPSLRVLDGHGCHTCTANEETSLNSAAELWLVNEVSAPADLRPWLPGFPPAGWQPSSCRPSLSTGPPARPSDLPQNTSKRIFSFSILKNKGGQSTDPGPVFCRTRIQE